MKYLLTNLIIIIAVFCSTAKCQVITVVNKDTNMPVNNVRIFSQDLEIRTDVNGRANLLDFMDLKSITISHDDYLDLATSWADLESSGFLVSLTPLETGLEIFISASGWQENIKEVTNRVATVNYEEISFANPQTSADLLTEANGVFMQKSQLGGGSPVIRGFAANRVLIAVDGIRMNNAIFRGGNLQNVISLDAASLERTEVVFGPGSIIYGSDALGGVMNFITLDPGFSSSDKLMVSGKSQARWSSASRETSFHYHTKLAKRNWALAAAFSFSNFEDLRMGSDGPDEYLRNSYVTRVAGSDTLMINDDASLQRGSGFHQFNFLLKGKYKIRENLLATLTSIVSNSSDIPRYDRLIQAKGDGLKYGDWYYGPQRWTLNSVGLEYQTIHPLFSSASLSLAVQSFEESRNDRKFASSFLNSRKENVDMLSFNLDLRKQISDRESFYYGFESVANDVGSVGSIVNISSGENEPTSSRYPNSSTWNSLAGYFSYKNRIAEDITLHTGLRYNRVDLEAKFDHQYFNFPFEKAEINTDAINGSLGIAWQLGQYQQLNFNTSTGFRAPNIDDAAKVFDSEPGNVVVPNPDLKPEYAWNTDLSLITYLGEGSKLEITGFYTHLTDAMIRKDYLLNGQAYIVYDGTLSRVQAVQNAESAVVKGLQTSLALRLAAHIQLKSSLNITRGETNEETPLRHVPPTFGDLHFVYTREQLKLDLFARYCGSISWENLAPSERSKPEMYLLDSQGRPFSPSWFTLNMRGSYQFSDSYTLFLGIENLLDRRYRPYSSGIAASGINFSLALSTSF